MNVVYCTDVEGNYGYWNRYIALSKYLSRNDDSRLTLAEGFHFVYGGDVCDRGAGDLRFLDDLNNLYDDHPGRVHFILGNRDVNKMRILIEMHQSYLDKPGNVFWAPSNSEDGGNKVERLKWILAKTMGSPDGFRYRKEELGVLGKPNSDEDVVQSYLDQARGADSPIMKYLSRGVVGVIFGDVLYCHGGLNETNMGWLPPNRFPVAEGKESVTVRPGPIGGEICDDFVEWLNELNRRVRTDVVDFIKNSGAYLSNLDSESQPHWAMLGTYDHDQPGSRVCYMGMAMIPGPGKTANPSVVYASYMAGGMPVEVTEATAKRLKDAGINRVVVGHQPHGDAPTVIQAHGIQIFMGDTSYSANTLWNYDDAENWSKRSEEQLAEPSLELAGLPIAQDDSRGVSVSDIEIRLPDGRSRGARSQVFIRGVLSDGSTYAFEVQEAEQNKYIGKLTASKDWMVKAGNVSVKCGPLKGRKDVYLLSRGEGFNFKNRYVVADNMDEEVAT